MGAYLSSPKTEKESGDGTALGFQYGFSSMQGWRKDMEDAHVVEELDDSTVMLGVFDGHGGKEVALYVAKHLARWVTETAEYKEGKAGAALTTAFLGIDRELLSDNAILELKVLGEGGDDEVETVDENEADEAAEVDALKQEGEMDIHELIAQQYGAEAADAIVAAMRGGGGGGGAADDDDGEGGGGEGKPTSQLAALLGRGANGEEDEWEDVDSEDDDDDDDDDDEDDDDDADADAAHAKQDDDDDDDDDDGDAKMGGGKDEAAMISSGGTRSRPRRRRASPAENPAGAAAAAAGSGGTILNLSRSATGAAADDDDDDDDADDDEDTTKKKEKEKTTKSLPRRPSSGKTNGKRKATDSHPGADDDDGAAAAEYKVMKVERLDEHGNLVEVRQGAPDSAETEAPFGDSDGDRGVGKSSGTTATVALLTGNTIVVANAGDTRCILCRGGATVPLSFDHKPEDDIELARIEKAGGMVSQEGRIDKGDGGGLNLSRALGDHQYKRNGALSAAEQMVSPVPDLISETLTDKDEFLVLACDGIWNSMENEEVVDFVRTRLQSGMAPSVVCEQLCDACMAQTADGDGSGCDNETAMVVLLAGVPAGSAANAASVGGVKDEHWAETTAM